MRDGSSTKTFARWVHRRLIAHFGEPEWETRYAPLEELIGTILSQHTSDVNSERAFRALMATYTTWEAVRDAPVDELVETIRSGGLAVVKAVRIQSVLRALTEDDGRVRLADLRGMPRAEAVASLTQAAGRWAQDRGVRAAVRLARGGDSGGYARTPRGAAPGTGRAADRTGRHGGCAGGGARTTRLLRLSREHDSAGPRSVQGAAAALRDVPATRTLCARFLYRPRV